MKRITAEMELQRCTRIQGPFYGWTGDTVVELDNGQRWMQASYRYKHHYRYRPGAKVWKLGERLFVERDGLLGQAMEVKPA